MIVLLGLPGAGKGSLAKRLADSLNYKHVSVGELLRNEINKGTDLGRQVKQYVESGDLVPDEIITSVVLTQLEQDSKIILDGYPRNTDQAEVLSDLEQSGAIDIDAIILLNISEETIFKRLRRRREIENRPDDTDEIIQKRIDIAKEELVPVFEYFKDHAKFGSIDGEEEMDQNLEDALKLIEELK